jgi:DNA-binding CsgD family transcriptional regulator
VDTFAGLVRMAALCHVGAHTGDTVSLQAGRAAARAVRADASPAVRRLATRLLVTTATGPGAAAAAARLLADDPLLPATPLVPCDYGYQPRVARMALEVGAHDLAERAAAVTESVDRRNPGVPLFAGLAAQTRGLVTRDPGLLVEAARLLLGTRRPLVAASAAEDAGRALAGLADTAGAVDRLSTAFDLYRDLGANADARRVARLLRRQGVVRRLDAERPRVGWSSLTGSELQVVRLIGRGATNRTAAEQLYLSPHTVSSHLRSAFTKLGINSRVQLARVLQEVEP